jgi:hypothetical protein
MSTIDQFEQAINGERQAWLTLTTEQGVLVADIHGHFAAPLESDSPEAIGEALAGLFDSLAAHTRDATGGVLRDLGGG